MLEEFLPTPILQLDKLGQGKGMVGTIILIILEKSTLKNHSPGLLLFSSYKPKRAPTLRQPLPETQPCPHYAQGIQVLCPDLAPTTHR